ncbi:MAG: hypothetical protein COB73_00800 [Flavobacteriaceae bacterium]|nr:MAG: hypothetical protein COB73_00800 [Flavobacteriaceae bacterium]
MAKKQERSVAKQLFIQGKTQKEIAALVSVQEKTIGEWVKKFGWKSERDARMSGQKNQIENIKAIISAMAEDRLYVHNKIKAAQGSSDLDLLIKLQREAAILDDGVSKWNKTLENLDKENRVSLSVYLDVMDDIFKALSSHDMKVFMKTISFQESHLSTISLKLG